MSDAVEFALVLTAAVVIATVPLWGPRVVSSTGGGEEAHGPWWAEAGAEDHGHDAEEREYYEETSTVIGVVVEMEESVGRLTVRTPSGESVDVLIRGVWYTDGQRISWEDLVDELRPGTSVEVTCHYSETWGAWMATELRYDGFTASRFGG